MFFFDYIVYVILSISKIYLFSSLSGTEFEFGFFLLNLATVLILSCWTLLLKVKTRQWILLFLLFLHSTLLISDLWYYRYFEDFLSISLLSDITQINDVSGGFLTLIQATDFFFFADLLLFGAVIWFSRKRHASIQNVNRKKYAGIVLAAGIGLYAVPMLTDYFVKGASPLDPTIADMQDYYQFGFWGYHGLDLAKGGIDLLSKENRVTAEEESLIRKANKGGENTEAVEEQPNVILVQLESFQSSVIHHEVDGQELTPNLNKLTEEMLYFPSFYHQTHEGRTSDAEFIVNTSLQPLRSGSVYTQYEKNEFDSLPAALKENGYTTAAMHAYEKDFWNRDSFYQNIGFDQFFSKEDYPEEKKIGMAVNDTEFFTTSISHMERLEQPFFAFLVALTSHIPYEIPEEDRGLDLSSYEDPLLKGYYQTIHYVDGSVGAMVQELKDKDIWDDALVVFYGDHDSGLQKNGSEMAKELEVESRVDQFELSRQVPLFIKPPKLAQGETVDKSGGQIDITPTILAILGISQPYVLGQSLMDEEENLTVFRDGSFRYEDVYYLPDLTESVGSGTCYSIETEEEIPFDRCKPQISKAAKQLQVSDTIIQENALDELRQSSRP
ncbi:LTA synthase family protein [Planococcus sp. NCCP-2050]|uniref:LTA synthase family protein n=1 Tax=Planococcus sp. NCCP-2050 TaxID=2944679 RepID=UPI00203A9076|nr:LTA synthase family protein [Planococcus sp. NCCP-2050]GKW47201.1 sulfatase [Planococcus sp. NCCP-2050]